MEKQKKILCRVRLINWHFFENECITMHGSTLISGENTAGKSTILDAIQLVLTTNTRKFNVAANEKGNRDLKGYVRCKTGNVGETYIRKNAVPANVALEFFEEKTGRYFVLGVHMLSPDEESRVVTRWYAEECRLEDMSFVVHGKAALAEEFRVRGRRIRYIDQNYAARDRFKRRMGNLDDRFFDIIPKSLAFKPMDNVKEFINKFVLSEEKIDVAALRENIETLSELEELLTKSNRQLECLEEIINTYERIEANDYDIKVNDFLLRIAGIDLIREKLAAIEKDIIAKEQMISGLDTKIAQLEKDSAAASEKLLAVNVSVHENKASRLLEELQRKAAAAENGIKEAQMRAGQLKVQVAALEKFLKKLKEAGITPVSAEQLSALVSEHYDDKKYETVEALKLFSKQEMISVHQKRAELAVGLKELDGHIQTLQEKNRRLHKQILTYPENTAKLKGYIEEEFSARGISSKVYILSELLEITDETWRNAVEGYLNTQKFYLVVEPEYYDAALQCYHKNRKNIHSAGIINTGKLTVNQETDNNSLAYVVKSENRYAKAYIDYLLGRVMRCDRVEQLKEHRIAVTADCMLYQGYVVRNIDPKLYRNPYIGQNAFRMQIEQIKAELEEKSAQRSRLRENSIIYDEIIKLEADVNPELIQLYMNAPADLEREKKSLVNIKAELKEAKKDPSLLELEIKKQAIEKELKNVNAALEKFRENKSKASWDIEAGQKQLAEYKARHDSERDSLRALADNDEKAYEEAGKKYSDNRRKKAPETIISNFTPQKSQFQNERIQLTDSLKAQQYTFNYDYSCDFTSGTEGIDEYISAAQKLRTVELVKYEEKLKTAKKECEEIFRSDFLSKMKEHIEAARNEFRNLNKALDNIYYGDDSYHFKITFDRQKEGLYKMITSENNQEGNNLWTAAFEAEYREEISDLFDKLMTRDDKGDRIVAEYTDYRSYLDYDIEIRKKDGSLQKFSDIYGEKSGSETQVPYYVAIAASFYQLYRFGNSVRLMLLDEAFDKMDDERIKAMMDFFNSLDLQVILATPPAKIEIIGEQVGTILTAIRAGRASIVEEYDL